jgi:hypothetical protein
LHAPHGAPGPAAASSDWASAAEPDATSSAPTRLPDGCIARDMHVFRACAPARGYVPGVRVAKGRSHGDGAVVASSGRTRKTYEGRVARRAGAHAARAGRRLHTACADSTEEGNASVALRDLLLTNMTSILLLCKTYFKK